MQKSNSKKKIFKPQQQPHPGLESKMDPVPVFDTYHAGKQILAGKKCIITGGDSGIGRAIAVAFAKEGADVAIIHLLAEQSDADETQSPIRSYYNQQCHTFATDLSKEKNCLTTIRKIANIFTHIDVMVNNAGVHYPEKNFIDIRSAQLIETFAVNVFAMFWCTQAVLP